MCQNALVVASREKERTERQQHVDAEYDAQQSDDEMCRFTFKSRNNFLGCNSLLFCILVSVFFFI